MVMLIRFELFPYSHDFQSKNNKNYLEKKITFPTF